MKLEDVENLFLTPALSVLPAKMDSVQARVMMLTIGMQESRFSYRHQVGGPARGYWQFEVAGVQGVLDHRASKCYAAEALRRLDYQYSAAVVYNALDDNGLLAALIARLYLWTDPHALPDLNDCDGAWDLYLRTWRPGKPHRGTWDALHRNVTQYLGAQA